MALSGHTSFHHLGLVRATESPAETTQLAVSPLLQFSIYHSPLA
jgi:hypothetical protein